MLVDAWVLVDGCAAAPSTWGNDGGFAACCIGIGGGDDIATCFSSILVYLEFVLVVLVVEALLAVEQVAKQNK